jgi:hypothetical protein
LNGVAEWPWGITDLLELVAYAPVYSWQKKHGFAALGPADGTVKSAIFGYNAVRFYKLDLRAELPPMHEDGIANLKAAYLEDGRAPSETAYGFVAGQT